MTANDPKATGLPLDRRFLRRGKMTAVIYLPHEFVAPIGMVIVHWGNFEMMFDKCLEALVDGEVKDKGERNTENWKRWSFRDRRVLFKAICSEWLSQWRPKAVPALLAIADRAGDLGKKRNFLAHGTFAYTIPPSSDVATNCRAVNNETAEEFMFTDLILKKLYHDIAHLTADLVVGFKECGEIGGDLLLMPDEEMLRTFRETRHPWHGNPEKRADKPTTIEIALYKAGTKV